MFNSRFAFSLMGVGVCCGFSAALLPVTADADEMTSEWMHLGTQTCVAQAPSSPYIAKLNLGQEQLQYSCRCVVKDMVTLLPENERASLLRQMRQKQNLQAVGEKMFERPAVKNAVLMCSAAYFWR